MTVIVQIKCYGLRHLIILNLYLIPFTRFRKDIQKLLPCFFLYLDFDVVLCVGKPEKFIISYLDLTE